MPGTGRTVPYGADQTALPRHRPIGSTGRRSAAKPRSSGRTSKPIIADLLSGQFNDPVRVIAFNTLEHWSRDVSRDIAAEIQQPLRHRRRSRARAYPGFRSQLHRSGRDHRGAPAQRRLMSIQLEARISACHATPCRLPSSRSRFRQRRRQAEHQIGGDRLADQLGGEQCRRDRVDGHGVGHPGRRRPLQRQHPQDEGQRAAADAEIDAGYPLRRALSCPTPRRCR